MGSPRVKGTTLSMLVDGVDYWADVTSVVLDGEDRTFDLFDGTVQSVRIRSWFDVEAAQSTATGSFWTFLYLHQGQDVPFAYAPHGNPEPTVDEPHFTGILTVPGPPRLGGAAGRRVEQSFITRLYINQGPLRVTET